MWEEIIAKTEFICPRCRCAGSDGIVQSALTCDQVFKKEGEFVLEGFWVCSNGKCRSTYPILEGVPVVLKDIKAWWRSEKHKLFSKKETAPELSEYFKALDLDEPLSHTGRTLLSSYTDFHYGAFSDPPSPLARWADPQEFWQTVIEMTRPETEIKYDRSLDLGCSVGRYTFELARLSDLAIGMDLDFSAVSSAARFCRTKKISYERRKHGRRFEEVQAAYSPPQNALFVVADCLDPPFRAESFNLIGALNLVDNVRLPLVLIGQMDALLRPAGDLILGSPYEWRVDISEPGQWLENDALDGAGMVRNIIEGSMFPQMGLKYALSQELLNVPWVLRQHARHWRLFLVHLIKARKRID